MTGPHPRLSDPQARRWVDAALQLTADALPDEFSWVEATADARGSDLASTFAGWMPGRPDPGHRDEVDGCAVGARRHTGGGAWVVKNRDNRPDIRRRHVVAHHVDPAWDGHAVLATSTAGGPSAASGGINTRGLCVLSTGTYLEGAPPGVPRSMLIGALLAGHESVESALELLTSVPHLGGTLTLADATGAVASVDLHPDAVGIERPSARSWVARTNHLCSTSVPKVRIPGPEFYEDSHARLARLGSVLAGLAPEATWDEASGALATSMSAHDGTDALCRHDGDLQTISTAIFSTAPVAALVSIGPGCEGRWGRWVPDHPVPAVWGQT